MELKNQKLREKLEAEQKELIRNIAINLNDIQNGKYNKNIRKALRN